MFISDDLVIVVLLLLHVAGAIVAFGPVFTFPVIGAMAGREPQHVNFALRLTGRIQTRMVAPLAVFQGVTGLLLIWRLDIDVLDVKTFLWLDVAIVLYVAALAIVFRVGIPTTVALIAATSAPPPPPAAGSPPPSGPPPHVAALVKRQQQFGMITSVLLVLIIILMVTKPHLT
jgi:Predicted integral membrane protein (DUF2269)